MEKIPKQEDIFSAYDRRRSTAVGEPDQVGLGPGSIVFPQFEAPKPPTERPKQEELTMPHVSTPGLQTFNINDLIQKGLYDAAEYFLGRQLTSAERSNGLMSTDQLKELSQASSRKSHESKVEESLAKLVEATLRSPDVLKAAAEPKKDEKDDDDVSSVVRAKDGEEKEEKDDDEVSVFDEIMKKRFVDLYGEDDFDLQSNTDMSEWTRDMQDRYVNLVQPTDPVTPNAPQGGKYKEPLAEIIPVYNPDKMYTLEQAKAILNDWKANNPGLRGVPNNKLFSALPKNKKDWQTRLKETNQEIIKFKLNPVVANGINDNPHKNTIQWAPFGPKWLISPQRLQKEDVVSIVKARDKQKINKHPNRTVSAAMKVCLMEFLEGRPMPVELLSPDDKEWLDWLFHEAEIKMIKKPVQRLEIKRTPKQMKERLAVLYGEIAEGPNDNPLLKKEFRILFTQASLMGLLDERTLINMQEFVKTF